jgi:microsomal dipeptidase-like Zn-dependent dipeptidase
MPFFDFHCHPGLKPQFSDPATKVTPWDYIDAKLSISRDFKLRINKLFNDVLNSQSNLTQLIEADVKLIGLILHAPEQKIGQVLGEKGFVNKGKINLINSKRLAYLASGVHSYELITEELNWLKTAVPPLPDKKLKILNKASEFDETETGTVFGAIIIEGLHCFFNDPNDMDAKEIYLKNFHEFTDANTVVAINLCHMQQNQFCNHAHGIQFFNPPYFYPTRKGITEWGMEMIKAMINKKILVDIKHMSLKARWELYTYYNPNGDDQFVQPLICTHAGTTGISIRDRVKYLLNRPVDRGLVYEVSYLKPKSRHFEKTYHNCSSINLYNEDIENILLSGGIIGLSFDQRILGFADESVLPNVTVPHDLEYISHQEAEFFLGPQPTALPVWPDDTDVWAAEDFEEIDQSLYIETHRRFLVNNIIHILWVANKNISIDIKDAVKQICVGTDFDGLINAIDCCKQTNGMRQLKKDMRSEIIEGLTKIFGTADAITADELLDNVFYNNGKNFMLKRLKEMKG